MTRFCFVAILCFTVSAFAQNLEHEHHKHKHGQPHPLEKATETRFLTPRQSNVDLPLPAEKEMFTFVVFGDRTGGPVEGVSVLADAVRETNLLEPDFVINVGDMVNGYNATELWKEQMSEFKGIMNELLCPWFPVSGNHDIYWRGEDMPTGQHETNYEMHFGPLFYAFKHKNSFFIVLYSDEGNPETGEKNFSKPESQKMSTEQFTWLQSVLEKAKGAEHVFLFLHHPRWLGVNYGDDWQRVHKMLVDSGNVTAVFAGHIHEMRYDPKDGIEYVTLAMTGAGGKTNFPKAGHLHEFHHVTVRKSQVALSAIPVGAVIDVRDVTAAMRNEMLAFARQNRPITPIVGINADGTVDSIVSLPFINESSRPIDITVAAQSADSRWIFDPDHRHFTIPAGEEKAFEFRVKRHTNSIDSAFRAANFNVQIDYLTQGSRISVPEFQREIPMDLTKAFESVKRTDESVLRLDGLNDALKIPNANISLPNGPFTLEAWMRADEFGDRTALISKMEMSEYGILVSKGKPVFSVFLGDAYVNVQAKDSHLEKNRWTHLAGVFDGKEIRLYVDGKQIASSPATGKRKTNSLPLFIGADVNNKGEPVSFLKGDVDSVRLSKGARYIDKAFEPQRNFELDAQTVLQYDMQQQLGPWIPNVAKPKQYGQTVGNATVN